ncbi:WD40 repeat domain-containing serine/threonine-protein kinase [Kamptonema formosum]|uniref:WD40 repeat domain-containing serine/threonine-protein kinase n=1 Tax=Kamptonema formosum TaxID=331992 RepID=UPI00034C5989|nr:WD40 repeat domain-containing serine/threonine-protein kinase [Oscillatoria sp. PCC 10802]
MHCCLNPDCQNPHNPDGTKFCQNCRTPLVLLRIRYRPIQLLSNEGGFGRTYLAEDIDKLNERCVIKQLAPKTQGTAALRKATELFEQEARRLQQLGEHPQIPTLYAYFEQDGHLYLVQQFIEGETLGKKLQQGLWGESQVRNLLLELLPVLQFIHERDIIHRDIKPPNIICRTAPPNQTPLYPQGKGGQSQFVLIDFGASKQLAATLSVRGTQIGTLGYAPFEQMDVGEAYPASDLFSLGVTCFQLLTQANPYALFLNKGYEWVGTWRQHLRQSVSLELQGVLDKLLQKERLQRYQSAAEVLRDLQRKPQLTPPPLPPRQPKWTSPPPPPSPPKVVSQPTVNLRGAAGAFTLNLIGLISRVSQLNKNPWMAAGAILLSELAGTQIYGLFRYQIFPSNPIDLISSPFFLKNTLTGHTSWVASVAISPDGKTLVSSSGDNLIKRISGDNTIKIWNLDTGTLQKTLTGHTDWVFSVAISPDGKTLVSSSRDNTIKIWNLETGTLQKTLTGHTDWVNSVAISPDGKTLVSGSNDNTIKIWNPDTGTLQNTLTGHTDDVNSVAISPDGKTLVSGSSDSTIKIWNPDTGTLQNTLTGHTDGVQSVAISPDGKTLVSGSGDNTIKIWNLDTGTLQNTLTGHTDLVRSVAISPDGKTLVSGSWDNTIKIWNPDTGTLQNTLTGHTYMDLTSGVLSVAISPDGKTLVSGSGDKTIKIWRMP